MIYGVSIVLRPYIVLSGPLGPSVPCPLIIIN